MNKHSDKSFLFELFSPKSKYQKNVRVFGLFLSLIFFSFSVFANSYSQSNWNSGVLNSESSCTAESGVWNGIECVATDGSNQTGWSAFAQKDDGINIINAGEDLELNHAIANSSSIISNPFNTADSSSAIELIKWNEILQPSTDIQIQIRTAPDDSSQPGVWSSWMGPDGTSNSFWDSSNTHDGKCSGIGAVICYYLPTQLTTAKNNQWFQIAITLNSSVADTATLSDFTIIYSTGRLGQWRFDGNAKDETSRARTAQLSSTAMFVVDDRGTALSTDGLDGYAKVSGYAELGVTTPYTYEGWFKINNGVTDGTLIHLSETSNGRGLCYSPVALVNEKLVASSFDGAAMNTITSTTEIIPEVWNHFANTWDPVNGLKLYLNGVLQGTSIQASLGTTSANMFLHFGFDDPEYTCLGNTGTYFFGLPYDIPVFHGELDEISVYNVALDAEVIASRTVLEDVPIPAVFNSDPVLKVLAGESYAYEILVSDVDLGDLIITGSTLPSWLTLTDYGNGYAVLSGTPAQTDMGLYEIELSVSDGVQTSHQTFQITVSYVEPSSYWKYDNDALDSGPNARNGTLYAGATFSSGIVGDALTLDGVDDRVHHGSNSYFAKNNSPYTHMGWINVAPGETVGNVLYIYYSTFCFVPISLVDGKLVATSKNSSGSTVLSSTTTLTEGNWYHYANTWDAVNGLRLYVNGVLEASTSQSTFVLSIFNHSLYVGYSSASTSCSGNTQSSFAGSLDELRFFKESLDADQIARYYDDTLNKKPTGTVSIDGDVVEKSTLYANTSLISDGNGLGALTYQWIRSGREIAGESNSSYVLTQDDVNHVIQLKVSFTDGSGYAESLGSALTLGVVNVNDLPTGTINIVGEHSQGQTIAAKVNLLDADGLGLFNYQWYKDGLIIAGENTNEYELKPEDVGSKFTVKVTYIDGYDTVESILSSESVTIANVNDLPEGEVTISGVLKEGYPLIASNNVTDIDGKGAVSYQWMRNGIDIADAIENIYTPDDLDVNQKMSVRITYIDGYGTSESVTSESTDVIANTNDLPTGKVLIVGTFKVGEMISLDERLIDADGLGEFRYSWRGSSSGSLGVTSNNYLIGESDVGTTLSVVISYIDGHGTLERYISPSSIVIIEGERNQAPVITAIQDVSLAMNTKINGIRFNVSDDKTPLSQLNVSAHSQDNLLILDNNIQISQTETGYELTLTPLHNAYGSLTIAVKASDGELTAKRHFVVTLSGKDTDKDGIPDLVDLDDDNDKIPDSYELANNMNPLDASDAALDSNKDGKSNLDNYLSSDEQDINAELNGTMPTITLPQDIFINARGLYTFVDLGQASAQDGLGNDIATFADQVGPFKPGAHIVRWTASDAAGNVVSAEQTVNVTPIVNFTTAQTVDEGSTVEIIAKLNGNAARYPVTIPYKISGTANNPDDHNLTEGNIIIQGGLEGSVSVDIVKDELRELIEESIIIEMGEPQNAIQGSMTKHTIHIVEYNIAPSVALSASQNDDVTNIVVVNDGTIIVSTDIDDPNREDTHSYNWSFTDNSLVDIDEFNETFSIDASMLDEGLHTVRLTVNDSGTPMESAIAELTLSVVNKRPSLSNTQDNDNDGPLDIIEGHGDDDGDRIPNYLDAIEDLHVIPLLQKTSTAYLVESLEGLNLRLGKTAFAAGDNGAGVTLAQFDKYSNVQFAIDNIENIGGYADLELHGIASKGDTAMLVVPQLSEIPQNAMLRILKPTGWDDYIVDDNNSLQSAPGNEGYCPSPGDESYNDGLTAGYWCVQIIIEDGGQNDADAEKNAVIQFSGGVGKQADNNVENVITETVSKASLLYLLLSSFVLFVWRRKL